MERFFGNRMDDGSFRLACALRLHLPIDLPGMPVGPIDDCRACGKAQDALGDHAFRCPATKAAVTRRHTAVSKELFHSAFTGPETGAVRSRVAAARESPIEDCFGKKNPDARVRYGDIVVRHAPDTLKNRVLDFVVTAPAPDRDPEDADIAGAAARRAEKRKLKEYSEDHEITERDLVPIALETMGTMGQKGSDYINNIADVAFPVTWINQAGGAKKAVDFGGRRAAHIARMRVGVSVTLQEQNAGVLRCWAACCVGAPHAPHHAAAVGAPPPPAIY